MRRQAIDNLEVTMRLPLLYVLAISCPALAEPTYLPDPAPVLQTQEFECGERELARMPVERLESFLQDLNRRKDYDYSQHNGQPGPDAAYLWKWVQAVTRELESRGYTSEDGKFLRPDGTEAAIR